MKIFVIDDNRIDLLVVESFFRIHETNNAEIKTFTNPEECFRYFRTHAEDPDVFLVDLYLDDRNGFTFIEQLQQIRTLENTEFIILSAHEDLSDIQKAYRNEKIAYYLVKPFTVDHLQLILSKDKSAVIPKADNAQDLLSPRKIS